MVLIAGPTSVSPPHGPRLVRVETSGEMGEALNRELSDAAVLIMAAAVSDFLVSSPSEASGVLTLGFALETDDPLGNARRKLEEKGLEMVAVNEAGRADRGVEAETNQVTLIDAAGVVETLPLMSKSEVAERLLDHLEDRIS